MCKSIAAADAAASTTDVDDDLVEQALVRHEVVCFHSRAVTTPFALRCTWLHEHPASLNVGITAAHETCRRAWCIWVSLVCR